MTPDTVVAIVRQALELAMIAAGPLLLASLLMGLLVSVFQAATQINEMTLTFIPKLVVMFVVLVLIGPWTLQLLVDYVVRLIGSIPTLIG
ncbi:MAG: flagellar biosynthesis protein FliQ [Thiobacillus sp.]|nr:flagellar biosynthesis protein FliQ [Thiobacillus sp.]